MTDNPDKIKEQEKPIQIPDDDSKAIQDKTDYFGELIKDCIPLEEAINALKIKEYKKLHKTNNKYQQKDIFDFSLIKLLKNYKKKEYIEYFPNQIECNHSLSAFYLIAAAFPILVAIDHITKEQKELYTIKRVCQFSSIQIELPKEYSLDAILSELLSVKQIKSKEFEYINPKELRSSAQQLFNQFLFVNQTPYSHIFNAYALKVEICDGHDCIQMKVENMLIQISEYGSNVISSIKNEYNDWTYSKKCSKCGGSSIRQICFPLILPPILIVDFYINNEKISIMLEELIDFAKVFNDSRYSKYGNPETRKFGLYTLVSFSIKNSNTIYFRNALKKVWYKREKEVNSRISTLPTDQMSIKYAIYVKEDLLYLNEVLLQEELNKWKPENIIACTK